MPHLPSSGSGGNAQTFLHALEPIECIICKDGYNEAHQPVTLPGCRHVFGLFCLRTWVLSSNQGRNRCPICRGVLFEDDRGPSIGVGAASPNEQLTEGFTPRPGVLEMELRQEWGLYGTSRSTLGTLSRRSMELRGELERLESLHPSIPRGMRNQPHDVRTVSQGDDSAPAQAGTGEIGVQRETEASERQAEVDRQIAQIYRLRTQLNALDHLEARLGTPSTRTPSQRTSTPYPSTYDQR
jgi:hypothetical protein